MHWLSRRGISSDIALKAIAISAVVFNHAHPVRPFDYAGGMTVLLMLSGYSFARFALQSGDAQSVRRAVASLALKIWLPCAAIVLLSFVVRQKFSLSELLFFSNLFSREFLTFMFVWYPQVLLQILVFTFLLFCIPAAADGFLRNPLRGSLVLLTLAIVTTTFWPEVPHATLPWRVAWNFLLGWVAFFLLRDRNAHTLGMRKTALVAGTVVCAGAVFGPADPQFWTLSAAMTILALKSSLILPSIAVRVLYVVGQASFTIFLLHTIFLRVHRKVLGLYDQDGAWIFAMIASTLAWVAGAAAMRAYRRVSNERTAEFVGGAKNMLRPSPQVG
jgi:peptidoglycan/LPS O-acetylase OafA/YrhL